MAAIGEMADRHGADHARMHPTVEPSPAMRSTWHFGFLFRLLSLCVVAMMLADVVAYAGASESHRAGRIGVVGSTAMQAASVLGEGVEAVRAALVALADWVRTAPTRTMALLIGFFAILALVPVAMLVRGVRLAVASRRLRQTVEHAETSASTSEVTGFSRPRRAFLEGLKSDDAEPFEIRGELVRIGRAADNELVVAATGIEPYHAAIARTADWDLYLCDLTRGSRTAARVNGRRVGRHRLSDGDVIALGGVQLTYRTARL